MIESFTDWLGQEVRVGDRILYCAQSGRSANMAMGDVIGIKELTERKYGMPFGPLTLKESISSVRVQPVESARWRQWHPRDVFHDSRDGSVIKHPYSDDHWNAHGLKSYVVRTPAPIKPVSLTVLGNITKWSGDARHA